MATIVTRAGKGSPLTHAEVDGNFTGLNNELAQKEVASNKGAANGYASLDGGGKVPAAQLPSYVDDVIEAANFSALPGSGETGKIYVTVDNNKTYRWSGSAYIEISPSPGSTDSVTEGSTNLYFTQARARQSISVSGSLSYNSSTGVLSYSQPTNVSTFTNDSGYVTSSALNSYLPLSGGTLTGSLDVGFGGGDLNIRATAGNDLGDLVWRNYSNTEIHRLWDSGGEGLQYRYNAGTGYKLLHAGNYTSYSPSLTGGGASGTWGINITGNAATVSSITSGQVTTALGYTPYPQANNPGGFITPAGGLNGATNGWSALDGYGTTVPNYGGSDWWVGVWTGGNDFRGIQLAGGYSDSELYFRKGNTGWSAWRRLLTDSNYTSYAPTLTGGGASGTWSINVTGSAGSVAWGNVSSKPSYIMYYQGFTLDANTMDSNATGFTYSNNAPHTGPVARFSTGGGYDLWLNAPYIGGGTLSFRTRNGDTATLNAWRTLLSDSNYNSYAPTLTGGGASGTWSINVTGSAGSAPANGGTATALNGSNYISRTGTSGNYNTDFSNTPAGTVRHHGDDSSATNNPGGVWWFIDNYRHSNSSNVWGTQIAWGWEDNANRLAQRNVTGGNWSGWVYYLNSSNYTSYSPSLTGSGASGTWSINVTGNAGTAYGLSVHGGRNNEANKVVRTDGNGYLQTGYINSSNGDENNASSPARVWGTNGSDSYLRTYQTGSLSVNYANSAGSVSGGLTTSNYSSYALPLSGGTMSGTITSTANSIAIGSAGGVTRGYLYNDASAMGFLTNGGSWAAYVPYGTNNWTVTGNITVSSGNATGGGIILADDGDIVDLNDGYCAMRFSNGVRIHAGNRTGGAVIALGNGGNIVANGNVTAYGSASDIRLKENITPITGALDKVDALSGYYFNYKGKQDRLIGVIAQEAERVLPEVVYDYQNQETGEVNKAVRYENMVALLIEAVKELKSEVVELKSKPH
ncbi:MAG: tail fiber domain-containing protein [Candidatus Limnocylindrus sp.]